MAELEAKLGKAQDQLTDMRGQLAAAEKARKDARAALVEAKKRSGAAKKRDATTSAPVEDGANVPAEQKQQAEVVTADVTNGCSEERRSMSSPATYVLEPIVPSKSESKSAQVEEAKKTTNDDDEVNNIAIIADDDVKKGNPEADQLRTKLMAKDAEVFELRAKMMVKDTEIDELTAKLMAKDAEVAALEADNADLMKMAEESSEAAKETATKAREIEHALRERAAREARVAERLRASERAREALEAEMQRSRVQSEQWRKAAEEAAVVLGEVDHHAGARGAETDKDRRRHSSVGSTAERMMCKDADDGSSSGKRKAGATGGAMRMLSDLWKKGQK